MIEHRRSNLSRFRPSFTLVELLVSMAIIGIMAGMVLFTLAGAREDALRSRTRVTIEKINTVILERWEGYRYRSVKLPIPQSYTRRTASGAPLISSKAAGQLRTILLRDMMRMEMPDRQSDLTYMPVNATITGSITLQSLDGRNPSREYDLLRNYFNLATIGVPYNPAVGPNPNTTPASADRPAWTPDFQSAECLYAIVAHTNTGFGSALEAFHTSEIADTDGDSYPEFVDAWGTPIGWIRWPAGYESVLNSSYKLPADSPAAPDAFDPLRTDIHWNASAGVTQKPWTLVPLIVSAGADTASGLDASLSSIFATNAELSPFMPDTDSPAVGRIVDYDAAADNVTNHDLLLE